MKRRIGLISILALVAIVVLVPPVRADVTDLYIDVTDYERNPTQDSTFDMSFTVHVPSDVTIPSSTSANPCFLYYSTFYFVGDEIKYPAEGYWWGDYEGSTFYNSGVTNYIVKVKMLSGDDAPVGQEFYLGIYWKIPLESDYQKNNDNITFQILGDDNTYTMSIVDTDVYPDYTKYTIHDGASDFYVRDDQKGYLYVRTLKSGLTVSAAPGFEIPLWIIIAGVVVLVVVIVAVVLATRKRGAPEELPPPPEMAPPPPPEAPPAPPETPPPETPPPSTGPEPSP